MSGNSPIQRIWFWFILAWEREEKQGKEERLRENPSGWQWGMTSLINSGSQALWVSALRVGRHFMVGPHECHLEGELWPGWRSTHQPPSGGSETASLLSSFSPERGEGVPRMTQPSKFCPRTIMECKYLEILWLFSALQGTKHPQCIPKARRMSPASEDPWPARIKGKKQSDKGPFLPPPAILCLLVFVRHSFSGPKCPLHGGRRLSIWSLSSDDSSRGFPWEEVGRGARGGRERD